MNDFGTPTYMTGRNNLSNLLLQYCYLQILDLLTTVAFLSHGVQEGNPLVRFAMTAAQGIVPGLIAIKIAGLLLGLYCWRMGRSRLLSRINILFAVVIAWNLVALIRSSAA